MKDIQKIQKMVREGNLKSGKGTIVMVISEDGYSFFKLEDVADMIWNIGFGSVYTKYSDKSYSINNEEAFNQLLEYWIMFLKGESISYVEIHNY